jgi:tetrahydromethanopterin S-methyltransferase subunit H
MVMDHTGDSRHVFDRNDAAALARAEERFKDLTGRGFTAAVREGEGQSRLIKAFDPAAEETLFFPRLVGG